MSKNYIFIKYWLILLAFFLIPLLNIQKINIQKIAKENEDPEAFYYLGRIYSEGLGGIKPQEKKFSRKKNISRFFNFILPK